MQPIKGSNTRRKQLWLGDIFQLLLLFPIQLSVLQVLRHTIQWPFPIEHYIHGHLNNSVALFVLANWS